MHEALAITIKAELEQRMSDGNNGNEANLERQQNANPDSPTTSEKREPARKSAKGRLNPDLKNALSQALGSWNTVTKEVKNKRPPDQEHLEDVKKLLVELKSKINQFDE